MANPEIGEFERYEMPAVRGAGHLRTDVPDELQRLAESVKQTPEQPDWNRFIKLTFDDSLRNSLGIIEHLESQGITNYRFYGEAATAMKPAVLADMGIKENKNSTIITPGKWLTEYVDTHRGQLTREEYMRRYMIKNSAADGTNYLELGQRIRDRFQRLYPQNWLPKLEETFGYHAALLHPPASDRKNHIQYWTTEQIQEDIETYETFMRAWLNVPSFTVRHLRPPQGGGFGYDTAFGNRTGTRNKQKLIDTVAEFRPGATWDLWSVDSQDAVQHGRVNYRQTAQSSVASIEEEEKEPLLLLHSNYYDAPQLQKLDQLSQALERSFYEKYLPKEGETIQRQAFVKTQNAWVRVSPISGAVKANLPEGTAVFIHSRVLSRPEWFKITWREGETGYIHVSQISFERSSVTREIPDYYKMKQEMEKIPERFRHRFTQEDRNFIHRTAGAYNEKMDWTQDQYFIVADRTRQFAALVYYEVASRNYWIVGDFGTKVSTGVMNVRDKSWATPLGVYDRKPIEDVRKRKGAHEWRADGTGGAGYGPKGSRIYLLGYVDVQSPYGKPATIVMHKTSRFGLQQLGQPYSHGCIRASDAFIDLLDRGKIMDGEYGRYVLVGDSSGKSYVGDFNQQI